MTTTTPDAPVAVSMIVVTATDDDDDVNAVQIVDEMEAEHSSQRNGDIGDIGALSPRSVNASTAIIHSYGCNQSRRIIFNLFEFIFKLITLSPIKNKRTGQSYYIAPHNHIIRLQEMRKQVLSTYYSAVHNIVNVHLPYCNVNETKMIRDGLTEVKRMFNDAMADKRALSRRFIEHYYTEESQICIGLFQVGVFFTGALINAMIVKPDNGGSLYLFITVILYLLGTAISLASFVIVTQVGNIKKRYVRDDNYFKKTPNGSTVYQFRYRFSKIMGEESFLDLHFPVKMFKRTLQRLERRAYWATRLAVFAGVFFVTGLIFLFVFVTCELTAFVGFDSSMCQTFSSLSIAVSIVIVAITSALSLHTSLNHIAGRWSRGSRPVDVRNDHVTSGSIYNGNDHSIMSFDFFFTSNSTDSMAHGERIKLEKDIDDLEEQLAQKLFA